MKTSDARILDLTRDEILICTDRVRNDDAGTEDMRVTAYRLLLKLGSAYLEVTEASWVPPNRTIPVAVTEAEAWLLRTKVTSFDKLSSDSMFGVQLLRKLYRALVDFNDDVDVPVGAVEGEAMTEWRRSSLHRRLGGTS